MGIRQAIRKIGPGLLVAAAGIGAGDMIMGIQIGYDFSWWFVAAVVLACVLKYVLTEGLARYQLITGDSLIDVWATDLPRWFRYVLVFFFLLWTVMVAAALMSACGVAGHALLPIIDSQTWGVIHALLAFALVYFGRYRQIERITGVLIVLMFFIVLITATYLLLFTPANPLDGPKGFERSTLLFAIIGGVGGSVTMLSYGYWLREKGWQDQDKQTFVKTDLIVSYVLTGAFVLSMLVIASRLDLGGKPMAGSAVVFGLSEVLQGVMGTWGGWLIRVCFWGVVASSMITVWSGVPYIFCDFIRSRQAREEHFKINTQQASYRWFLLAMTLVPVGLLYGFDVVRNVVNYTLISAVFVFGLAVSLVIMNNGSRLGIYRNGWMSNIVLYISLLIFSALVVYQTIS